MKAVIMAGGKGTRIRSIESDLPKPMVKIAGKPVLEYQLLILSRYGIKNIIIVVGYLGNSIKDFFGNGEKYGIQIEYIVEDIPLGSAGALFFLKDIIQEDFLLINGDIIFDIDIQRLYAFHKNKKAMVTLLTHPNDHPFDSKLVVTNSGGRVVELVNNIKLEQQTEIKNRVNAGIHVFSPDIFQFFTRKEKKNMDEDVLQNIIKQYPVYAYDSPEYAKDMGTPKRFFQVQNDINMGIVKKRNLAQKQKAVFFDRDGTINKYKGYITDSKQMELAEGIGDLINKIHSKGYLVIVITNQPVIARGECTKKELEKIHNRMEWLLAREEAYVDAIYYCPHHPDKGFKGEITKYKKKCYCRKPNPGMLYQAACDYNIDLKQSYMIGDSKIDIEAGRRAGCKCILVDTAL